jgi:hypothetical protein
LKTNRVSVDEFIKRFGFEFLKQKSMRNTVGISNNDGNTDTFQWAASLQHSKSKRELIEELRLRRHTPRKVMQSRTSYLRKAHGRQQRDYNVAVERKHYDVIQSALKIKPPAHVTESQRNEFRLKRYMEPTSKVPTITIPSFSMPADLLDRKPINLCVKPTPRDMGNVATPRPLSASKPPLTPRPPTAR